MSSDSLWDAYWEGRHSVPMVDATSLDFDPRFFSPTSTHPYIYLWGSIGTKPPRISGTASECQPITEKRHIPQSLSNFCEWTSKIPRPRNHRILREIPGSRSNFNLVSANSPQDQSSVLEAGNYNTPNTPTNLPLEAASGVVTPSTPDAFAGLSFRGDSLGGVSIKSRSKTDDFNENFLGTYKITERADSLTSGDVENSNSPVSLAFSRVRGHDDLGVEPVTSYVSHDSEGISSSMFPDDPQGHWEAKTSAIFTDEHISSMPLPGLSKQQSPSTTKNSVSINSGENSHKSASAGSSLNINHSEKGRENLFLEDENELEGDTSIYFDAEFQSFSFLKPDEHRGPPISYCTGTFIRTQSFASWGEQLRLNAGAYGEQYLWSSKRGLLGWLKGVGGANNPFSGVESSSPEAKVYDRLRPPPRGCLVVIPSIRWIKRMNLNNTPKDQIRCEQVAYAFDMNFFHPYSTHVAEQNDAYNMGNRLVEAAGLHFDENSQVSSFMDQCFVSEAAINDIIRSLGRYKIGLKVKDLLKKRKNDGEDFLMNLFDDEYDANLRNNRGAVENKDYSLLECICKPKSLFKSSVKFIKGTKKRRITLDTDCFGRLKKSLLQQAYRAISGRQNFMRVVKSSRGTIQSSTQVGELEGAQSLPSNSKQDSRVYTIADLGRLKCLPPFVIIGPPAGGLLYSEPEYFKSLQERKAISRKLFDFCFVFDDLFEDIRMCDKNFPEFSGQHAPSNPVSNEETSEGYQMCAEYTSSEDNTGSSEDNRGVQRYQNENKSNEAEGSMAVNHRLAAFSAKKDKKGGIITTGIQYILDYAEFRSEAAYLQHTAHKANVAPICIWMKGIPQIFFITIDAVVHGEEFVFSSEHKLLYKFQDNRLNSYADELSKIAAQLYELEAEASDSRVAQEVRSLFDIVKSVRALDEGDENGFGHIEDEKASNVETLDAIKSTMGALLQHLLSLRSSLDLIGQQSKGMPDEEALRQLAESREAELNSLREYTEKLQEALKDLNRMKQNEKKHNKLLYDYMEKYKAHNNLVGAYYRYMHEDSREVKYLCPYSRVERILWRTNEVHKESASFQRHYSSCKAKSFLLSKGLLAVQHKICRRCRLPILYAPNLKVYHSSMCAYQGLSYFKSMQKSSKLVKTDKYVKTLLAVFEYGDVLFSWLIEMCFSVLQGKCVYGSWQRVLFHRLPSIGIIVEQENFNPLEVENLLRSDLYSLLKVIKSEVLFPFLIPPEWNINQWLQILVETLTTQLSISRKGSAFYPHAPGELKLAILTAKEHVAHFRENQKKLDTLLDLRTTLELEIQSGLHDKEACKELQKEMKNLSDNISSLKNYDFKHWRMVLSGYMNDIIATKIVHQPSPYTNKKEHLLKYLSNVFQEYHVKNIIELLSRDKQLLAKAIEQQPGLKALKLSLMNRQDQGNGGNQIVSATRSFPVETGVAIQTKNEVKEENLSENDSSVRTELSSLPKKTPLRLVKFMHASIPKSIVLSHRRISMGGTSTDSGSVSPMQGFSLAALQSVQDDVILRGACEIRIFGKFQIFTASSAEEKFLPLLHFKSAEGSLSQFGLFLENHNNMKQLSFGFIFHPSSTFATAGTLENFTDLIHFSSITVKFLPKRGNELKITCYLDEATWQPIPVMVERHLIWKLAFSDYQPIPEDDSYHITLREIRVSDASTGSFANTNIAETSCSSDLPPHRITAEYGNAQQIKPEDYPEEYYNDRKRVKIQPCEN